MTTESDNVELELTPKVKESGIVTSFVFQRSINSVIVTLNHVYDKKIIISSVSSSDWGKIQDRLERRLKNQDIEKDHILQLIDTLDTNFEIILSSKEDDSQRQENSTPPREKKYTNDGDNKSYSFDDWKNKLIQKYENLYNVVQSNLPNLWHSLEFELSVLKILNIKDCTLPFGGIVLGRPSSLKTAGIDRKLICFSYYGIIRRAITKTRLAS